MMSRRLALLVALASMVTACGSGSSPATDTNAPVGTASGTKPPSEEAADVLAAFDDSDDPILVATPVCYSICSPLEVVPHYALYANRSLVWVERTVENGTYDSYRVLSYPLDEARVGAIAELMVDGGLTAGGVHATDTNLGIADGGGVVFETSIGDIDTYVHAPFLGSDPSTLDRDALVDLLGQFEAITSSSEGEVVDGDWVAVGTRISGDAGVTWPVTVDVRGGPGCLVFDVNDLPDGFADLTRPGGGRGMTIAFGDKSYVLYGRPLLLHEQGCSDVRATFERFATNDAGLELGGTG